MPPGPSTLPDLSLHILLALADGPAHGYAIGKEVEARSDGRLDPTTGALYQALKRLKADGLVAPAELPSDSGSDTRRKYFALTSSGRRAVADEVQRLDALVKVARAKNLYPAPLRRRS